MERDAAPVVTILFQAMVPALDLWPIQESNYRFLKRPGTFAGNDLDLGGMFGLGLIDDIQKSRFDSLRVAKDGMEVKFEFHALIVDRIRSCQVLHAGLYRAAGLGGTSA
jgi:hypothetical protein